jgi:hypothetical protein
MPWLNWLMGFQTVPLNNWNMHVFWLIEYVP